jgi:hypothetical protein
MAVPDPVMVSSTCQLPASDESKWMGSQGKWVGRQGRSKVNLAATGLARLQLPA